MAIGNVADRLGPVALAVVGLAVIVGIGSIVLTEMKPASYIDSTVTDETKQPSTPFPTNFTVDQASGNSDFELIQNGSETIDLEDTSAGTNTTLTEGTDYNAYYDQGIFEMLNTSATTDFDSANDNLYVDYTYEESLTSTSVLTTGVNSLKTFSDFFTVIIVIAISAVLFLLLRVVRGAGRSVSA